MVDHFFDHHQRETVSAALARLGPASNVDLDEHETAVNLLDRYLAGSAAGGYPEPDDRTHVMRRGLDLVRKKYVYGIIELDRRSRAAFGTHFTGLNPDQQDRVLADLEESEEGPEPADGNIAAGVVPDEASPAAGELADLGFLPLLAMHARPGFLAGVAGAAETI